MSTDTEYDLGEYAASVADENESLRNELEQSRQENNNQADYIDDLEHDVIVLERYARILRSHLTRSEAENADLRDETWRLGCRIEELEADLDVAYTVIP